MAKIHLEKAFQSEFTIAVKKILRYKKIDFVYHKIPDNTFLGNFRIQNPYDCYCRFEGQHWSIELKTTVTLKAFNFTQLFKKREHELLFLEAEKRAGGKSYVVVRQYIKKHNICRAFVIEIDKAREYHIRGKIPLTEIEKNNLEIFKIRKTMQGFKRETFWDLEEFFNL